MACGNRQRGFSMVEMAIVMAIGLIMCSIALLSVQPVMKDSRTNQAYSTLLMQVRMARAKAVENRQQFIVCFGVATPAGAATPLGAPTAQSIQVFQWPSGTAISSAVQVSTIDLPFDMEFQALPGLSGVTAPDNFGAGALGVEFDIGVAAAIQNQVMFTPDGSARDTFGNINNGVAYVARTGDIYSSRAISVYGTSGRIRGWRLASSGGVDKWIQQ